MAPDIPTANGLRSMRPKRRRSAAAGLAGRAPMSDSRIHIVVPGTIVPWQRARRNRLKSGVTVTFTRPDVEAYHAVVRMASEAAMAGRPPIQGPIELSLLAVFAVPGSWSGKRQREALAGILAKTTRPDLENSVKGAMDAMRSIVYRDDAQIVSFGSCAKVYGERPRLEILVSELLPMPRVAALGRGVPARDLFAGFAP